MSATPIQKLLAVGRVTVVSTTGKTAWTDYIPVAEVADSGKGRRTDDAGHIPVVEKLVASGTPWVDYIPVVKVATSGKRKWASDDAAYIPIFVTSTI